MSDATSYVMPRIEEAVSNAAKMRHQAEDVVYAKLKEVTPSIHAIPEGIRHSVLSARGEIETMACCGFEHIAASMPTIPAETPAMLSGVTDFVASFGIAQTGLKIVDAGLAIPEKILHNLEPVRFTKTTLEGIRTVRRYLRAVRHAGRRTARTEVDTETIGDVSTIGFIAELFQINLILGIFGFTLTPAASSEEPIAERVKSSEDEGTFLVYRDESETLAEKLSDEKMEEFNSSEDPDYEDEGESSEDSIEYNSELEDSIEEEVEHVESLAEELSDEKLINYNSSEDPDYEVTSEVSEDSLEYDSDAEEIPEGEESVDAEDTNDAEDSNEISQEEM